VTVLFHLLGYHLGLIFFFSSFDTRVRIAARRLPNALTRALSWPMGEKVSDWVLKHAALQSF
jgi:hypothetical protein